MCATLLNSHNAQKTNIFWKCSVLTCIPCTAFWDALQRKSWQVMLKSALKRFTSWPKPYTATGCDSVACDQLWLPFFLGESNVLSSLTQKIFHSSGTLFLCINFLPLCDSSSPSGITSGCRQLHFPCLKLGTACSCLLCPSLERGVSVTREAKWIWSSHAEAPVYTLPS